ncbi:MAG: tetratricopeptide repeat protein, partial [bacterium]
MFFRVRCFVACLLTIIALAYAVAQAPPVAPAPNTDAVEAQKMLMQAEGHMKVAAFEEATSIFRTILKRYPNLPERYQAQYRMSEALFELKKDNEGVALLQAMVNEAEPDWSPKALSRIGEYYKSKQKYQEAINAYRKVISDFPDSTVVDRAHFAIGIIYLQQGRYEP